MYIFSSEPSGRKLAEVKERLTGSLYKEDGRRRARITDRPLLSLFFFYGIGLGLTKPDDNRFRRKKKKENTLILRIRPTKTTVFSSFKPNQTPFLRLLLLIVSLVFPQGPTPPKQAEISEDPAKRWKEGFQIGQRSKERNGKGDKSRSDAVVAEVD